MSGLDWSVVTTDETGPLQRLQIEHDFVLDDDPVSPQRVDAPATLSIELRPEIALAAGEAHQQTAALELEAGAPPLPVEPRPLSKYGRRFERPVTQYAGEPYLKPRRGKQPPEGFWREYVYGMTLGTVNLGDSRAVRHRKGMQARIARPLDGARFIPVISRQGGVGATTVTALLGLALADARPDALAVDAHPDRGLLAERVEGGALGVIDPAAIDTTDGVVLTDAAHGDELRAALEHADGLVVVTGGTAEQARLASETVTWLHENELGELADNAVVAINTATPGTRYDSLDAIEAHFQARVRDVVRIPYDEELAGAPVRFGALRPDTLDAARDLAAKVMDSLDDGDVPGDAA